MRDAGADLDDLVAAVADGLPVDWPAAEESPQSAEDRAFVRELRHISSLAAITRTLPSEPEVTAEFESQAIPAEALDAPRWGHFALIGRLGAGAQGEVFRALDLRLQREVALKLRPQLPYPSRRHDAFLSEARLLARVRHPSVVTVYGADVVDERVGLWMELIHGETLDQVVRRNGPMSAAEAAIIGINLCGALSAVHAAGLLHRDLKAQNVMRESGGRCVLMDFGVGRDISKEESLTGRAGTPIYLAPEVLHGGPATIRSEVYSLAVLMYYLVTGSYPVVSTTMEGLVDAHAQAPQSIRRRRSDLPGGFVAAVEKGLNPNAAKRFAAAEEFADALAASLPDSDTEHPAAARPWSLPAVVGIAAVVVAATVWAFSNRTTPIVPANTVAVLPFADLSRDHSVAYLSEGLTELLTSGLGSRTDLRVIARTSATQFAESRRTLELAREAGVDRLVEGGVTPDNGAVKVSLRVLSADSGAILWSGDFKGALNALGELEDQMVTAAAGQLGKELTKPRDPRRWQGDEASMEDYFRGWGEYWRLTRPGFVEAQRLFQSAATRAPSFAEAHAAYAYARLTNELSNREPTYEEGVRAAKASADTALRLDPDSALAEAATGWAKFYVDWDWAAAETSLRRAVDLNPSDPQVRWMYGQLLMAENRLDAALSEANLVMRLDPLNPARHSNVAAVQYYLRNYEASKQELMQVLERDPNAAVGRFNVSRMFSALGQYEEGLKWLETASTLNEPWVRAEQARQLLVAGHQREARDVIRAVELDYHAGRLAPDYFAFVRAAEGDTEAAFGLLDEAVQKHSGTVIWIHVDPRYDSLRQDVRFVNILRRIGLAPALR